MALSDPILNCVLEVCCGALEAPSTLAKAMVKDRVCDEKHAKACADWIYHHFDLASKGSLKAFKSDVARLARQPRMGAAEESV